MRGNHEAASAVTSLDRPTPCREASAFARIVSAGVCVVLVLSTAVMTPLSASANDVTEARAISGIDEYLSNLKNLKGFKEGPVEYLEKAKKELQKGTHRGEEEASRLIGAYFKECQCRRAGSWNPNYFKKNVSRISMFFQHRREEADRRSASDELIQIIPSLFDQERVFPQLKSSPIATLHATFQTGLDRVDWGEPSPKTPVKQVGMYQVMPWKVSDSVLRKSGYARPVDFPNSHAYIRHKLFERPALRMAGVAEEVKKLETNPQFAKMVLKDLPFIREVVQHRQNALERAIEEGEIRYSVDQKTKAASITYLKGRTGFQEADATYNQIIDRFWKSTEAFKKMSHDQRVD